MTSIQLFNDKRYTLLITFILIFLWILLTKIKTIHLIYNEIKTMHKHKCT